jgi:hypothetical protein
MIDKSENRSIFSYFSQISKIKFYTINNSSSNGEEQFSVCLWAEIGRDQYYAPFDSPYNGLRCSTLCLYGLCHILSPDLI